eukprot:TRINITY_DN18356_c0_g1_i1.p1 TRINITY_DN18356_c0_g1~~TRINITY_DN18356_c0_g1_i1.p1  ORF type:complete len:711 (-),score=101.83 TRINITY_DN18356_c0_g1_i1:101-2233(-)
MGKNGIFFKESQLCAIELGACRKEPKAHEENERKHFVVRNLDTGEVHQMCEQGLDLLPDDSTFEKPFDRVHSNASPWRTWWLQKREQDDALYSAASFGCASDIRRLLSESGAGGGPPVSVDSKFLHGRTALHIAASQGRLEAVNTLLDFNACVNQASSVGHTALHFACQKGHLDVVRSLFCAKADIKSETQDGCLPLHVAAASGHTAVVSELLEFGSGQVQVRNRFQQRPVDMAGNVDVATLLQKAMEKSLSGDGDSGVEPSTWKTDRVDDYAGRTCSQGGVLRRNARRDVVMKLLQGTAQSTKSASPRRSRNRSKTTTPRKSRSPTPQNSLRSTESRQGLQSHSALVENRSRELFAKLLPDSKVPCIEEVGPHSFQLVKFLGEGSFGEIYQVEHKVTGQPFTMRTLQKSQLKSKSVWKQALAERNLLSFIRHPYIVSLHAAFQTPSHLVLVLQLCSNGDVQQLIDCEGRLPEVTARIYTAEILLAFEYLHERDIVFRALKPANVALDTDSHCMLTDFGLIKQGVGGFTAGSSVCGNIAFFAPEMLTCRNYGHTVDLYGLGVFLFCMLVGCPPFFDEDRQTLLANIKHARLHLPSFVRLEASSLISMLMERDPSSRLGARNTMDVEDHEFFDDIDFDALEKHEVEVPSNLFESVSFESIHAFDSHDPAGLGKSLKRTFSSKASLRHEEHSDYSGRGSVRGWDFFSFSFDG